MVVVLILLLICLVISIFAHSVAWIIDLILSPKKLLLCIAFVVFLIVVT